MKMKRLLLVSCSLFLLGTATAFAGSLWGEYGGYSIARVMVNGQEVGGADSDVPPIIINGSTMLPVRAVSDALHALVEWNDAAKTVSIYQPNVHMFVARGVDNSDYSIKQSFGKVKQGEAVKFTVFAQVDNLKANIDSFKISIETPGGTPTAEQTESLNAGKDSFWYTAPFSVSFDEEGSYTVKFSVKLAGNSDYTVVSEKQIVSE